MTGIEALDGAKVDSNKIVMIHHHNFTKFVEKEPELLNKAIKSMRDFLGKETPQWEKEPTKDELNNETFHGKEIKYLYQFLPENKHHFDEASLVIDTAMGAIPRLKMHMWKQLKIHRQTGAPVEIPFPIRNDNPPQEPVKKTILQKIGITKPQVDQKDEADYQIEDWMRFADDLTTRWGYFKEWYYGAIKYPENRGTWSDIYSRRGMEYFLARLQEFFDYYITTRFMMIFQYAVDLELRNITEDSKSYTDSLARQQREHEQNPPMS